MTDKKIIRPGTIKDGDIFIKIEWNAEKGNLSLSGVIGPVRGGNANGGAGQIDMEFAHRNPADNDDRYSKPIQPKNITFAPGWTADLWLDLLDIWKRWHLNDMQAGCEHQRAEGWGKKKVKIAHLKLNWDLAGKTRSNIERMYKAQIEETGKARITEDERTLLNLPYFREVPEEQVSQYADYYEVERIEEKSTNWVKETEHPEGVLSKPCPVCGYKYGSAWLREEVPADVLEWLSELPDTDRQPAWV
jgi:hypothetical protein